MLSKKLNNFINNKSKSILILTPAFRPNIGGVEVHLNDLTEYLRKNGYFVHVLTYQPITTKTLGLSLEKKNNLEVRRYSWLQGNFFNVFVNWHPIFNFLYLTPYLALRAFIFLLKNKDNIDVVHAIGLSTAFPAVFFKKIFNKPVVMTTETIYNFKKGSLFSKVVLWTINNLDHVLAQSADSKLEFVKLGIPENKITVFSHWINQDIFIPADKSKQKRVLGWDKLFTLLYVGRLIPEKGIRIAIETVIKLGKDYQLQIVGDNGPELEYVQNSVKKNNNIHFIGRVDHDRLPLYYQAADVFIYPALYVEDMAYVLLDALSCGTPVINSNPGSGIYKLPEGVGFVVKPEEDTIVKKIKYLKDNPVILRTMSKKAAVFAKKFGPVMAKSITDVYQKIVYEK